MAIKVTESWDMNNLTLKRGNFGNGESSATKYYIVEDADDERAAVDAAYSQSPAKIKDTNGKEIIPKQQASVVERCGERTWKVQVDYGFSTQSSNSADDEDPNDDEVPEVCFQCSASTTHITRPIDQKCVYVKTGESPIANPEKVLIGWNGARGGQMEASGVDVPSGETREQYVKILKYSKVRSSSWRRKVAQCVGRVNKGKFKGWKTGEAMFIGCSYSTPMRGVAQVKVTFEFLIRTNENNAKVCGHNIGDLNGHDYVWVVMGNTMANSITPVIKYIFKAQVVKYVDFDCLGL